METVASLGMLVFSFVSREWFTMVLFLLSLLATHCYWRNPLDEKLLNILSFTDEKQPYVHYISGTTYKGWIVTKVTSARYPTF